MIDLAVPFLLALVVSFAGTLVCERAARRIGLVAHPRADRWHSERVPLLGGVAIAVAVGMVSGSNAGTLGRFGPLMLPSLMMAAVGLIDDVRPLRPRTKLAASVVVAAVLIQFGTQLPLTASPVVNVLATLLWVVGITNAFNLLDSMDGVAAGVAMVATLSRLTLFLLDGDRDGAWMMAGLCGALGGFLVRNYPPAKIFMGDAGSLFLGFFLAGASIVSDHAPTRSGAAVVVLPALLLLVPILDTMFVTVTRLLGGRSVAQGGRDHTAHRLVALGLDERQALAVLLGISALSGLLAIASYRDGFRHSIVLLAVLVVGLVLLAVHLARAPVTGEPTARAIWPLHLVQGFPYTRHVATLIIDATLIVTAYYAAYLLRFEGTFEAQQAAFLRSLGPVLGLQILALAATGRHRGLWRYTSVPDLLGVVLAVTLGVGASVLYLLFTSRFDGLSWTVFVVDWALLVLLAAGSRIAVRVLREWLRPERRRPVAR